MISAPVRPIENKSSDIAASKITASEPRTQTRGHLALVDWAEPAVATFAPQPQTLKDPVCKSAVDCWFERSIFLLMASSVAAISACFLHL